MKTRKSIPLLLLWLVAIGCIHPQMGERPEFPSRDSVQLEIENLIRQTKNQEARRDRFLQVTEGAVPESVRLEAEKAGGRHITPKDFDEQSLRYLKALKQRHEALRVEMELIEQYVFRNPGTEQPLRNGRSR